MPSSSQSHLIFKNKQIAEVGYDRSRNFLIQFITFLFSLQLLLGSLTFTGLWNCPMMPESMPSDTTSMSMDMDCDMQMQMQMQMQKDKPKIPTHNYPTHHFPSCPLCSLFSLPNILLTNVSVLPSVAIIWHSLKPKAYWAQAPPIFPIQEIQPRAPPLKS